jgi:hypothetical protein
MSYEDYAKTTGAIIMPPGGKLIFDKNNEHIEADTADQLVEKLTEKRSANHERIGDPVQEVAEVLSTSTFHTAAIPVEDLNRPKPRTQLIHRVVSWLGNRRDKLGTMTFVPITESNRRAAICINCKYNKEWKSCSSCASESKRSVERQITILSQNRRTPFHNRLFACAVTGQANPLAVLLDESFLKHRMNYMNRLPNHCWLKRL